MISGNVSSHFALDSSTSLFRSIAIAATAIAGLLAWFTVGDWLDVRAAFLASSSESQADTLAPATRQLLLSSFVLISTLCLILSGIVLLEEFRHRITHDSETGLLSRDRFEELLLAQTKRGKRKLAMVYLDIGNIDDIGNTLGQEIADQLLVSIGKRLKQVSHGQCLACRISTAEFAVAIDQGSELAESLYDAAQQPIRVDGLLITACAYVGIADCSRDTALLPFALKHARQASQEARMSKSGEIMVFDDQLLQRLQERRELERELAIAMDRNELTLHYQPIIDTYRQQVVAIEALLRWDHPTRGEIPPEDIIQIADASGLIHRLGPWVLEEACRQMSIWQHDLGPSLRVSVNVSNEQFASDAFLHSVVTALRNHQLHPNQLQLEISEHVMMDEPEAAEHRLSCLQENGISVALDHFGLQHTKLADIAELPVSGLKVPVAHYQGTQCDHAMTAVIGAASALADALDIELVAVGVESDAQRQQLNALGVHTIQGYVWAAPSLAEDVAAVVKAYQSPRPGLPRLVA